MSPTSTTHSAAAVQMLFQRHARGCMHLARSLPDLHFSFSTNSEFLLPSFLQVAGRYTAVYLGLGCSFNLSIPRWKWRYRGIVREFQPEPIHVRCLGSTPVSPTLWVDLLVHKQYSTLFRYGTSGTGAKFKPDLI